MDENLKQILLWDVRTIGDGLRVMECGVQPDLILRDLIEVVDRLSGRIGDIKTHDNSKIEIPSFINQKEA